MTAEIKLSRGMVALVDEADVGLVSGRTWYAGRMRAGVDKFYAMSPGNGREIPTLYMHRLILAPAPGLLTDHINGNGLDNRRANLRCATKSQNLMNSRNGRNSTGYRGVSPAKRGKPFVAVIQAHGKMTWLGAYDEPKAAALAYDAAARVAHGEFAQLNFPGGT